MSAYFALLRDPRTAILLALAAAGSLPFSMVPFALVLLRSAGQ